MIACAVCGVATDQNTELRRGQTPSGQWNPSGDVTVGTCPDCVTLDNNTVGLAVRACLRVLGKPESDWPAFATVLADNDVDATGVLFETSPDFRHGPQRKAWQHIDRDTRDALRRCYAAVLADRVAAALPQPEPVPGPPEAEYPQGCLACGIGLSLVWEGPVLSTGLTSGPEMATGVVCPRCAQALRDSGGGVGPSWFERAVQEAKGIAWTPHRVKPWIATGLDPQREPFAWMDVQEPPLDLDPITVLMEQVADLAERLAVLESRDRGLVRVGA